MRTKNPMAKKPAQILFSKNTYGPQVKVDHWDYITQAGKKDNYVYRDQLSNHLSTYVRWGNEDQGVRMTETRNMLKQVFTKTDPVYSFKPLVNFTSYPCTEMFFNVQLLRRINKTRTPTFTKLIGKHACLDVQYSPSRLTIIEEINNKETKDRRRSTRPLYLIVVCNFIITPTPGRNKLMKNADLAQLPANFGVMDYLSTQQDDYRNPYPSVTKPLTMPSPTWLLNRVIRSDLTHNHGTAPPRGNYQCLDTHTPIGHIRQMRLFRYQSFDPATCLQNFPTLDKPLDDNQNK